MHPFLLRRTDLPAVLGKCVLACGVAGSAHAADSAFAAPAGSWTLSGFGTLGAVHSSNREVDFVTSILQPEGAGRSGSWSKDVDSRLGLQLDGSSGRWSGVLQVVSEQRLDHSYRPQVEWANIKYQFTPDFAVRAGRIALPAFLAADHRKVGYIVPWVRPPVEVYGALPISSSDGVDATLRWHSGALRHVTQAFYGYTNRNLHNTYRLQASSITGLSHSVDQGAFSGRVSILTGNLTTGLGRQLWTALRAYGPQGAALAGRYAIEHKRVTLSSVGLSYDPGAWFVTAEGGHTRSDSFLGKSTKVYVGAGYRVGALTPYAGYAKVRAGVPLSDPGLPLAGLPPPYAAAARALNAGLNGYLASVPVQDTWSAGLRWDAASNLALKAQVERVRTRDGSLGMLIHHPTPSRPTQAATVTSVALDFVF